MTTDLENLKIQIKSYNKKYREGIPDISDLDYDNLLDKLRNILTASEYSSFRETLLETPGKIKHPFIMGSLEKIKAEDEKSVKTWLNKVNATKYSQFILMGKVDGMSCRLHYSDGKFISASSRGDGEYGEDITEKVKIIIPQKIPLLGEIDIRGELVITNPLFEKLNNEQKLTFKNPRNATVGIINRKNDLTLIPYISFIAYEIMGNTYTRLNELIALKTLGFTCVNYLLKNITDLDNNEKIVGYYDEIHSISDYDIDGLVICKVDYISENAILPSNMIAFKTNQLVKKTTLINIEWCGPSKDGLIIPVAIIAPIDLGGAMISRATCYNAAWIKTNNLKYGSTVTILKSGDIIPKIISVEDGNVDTVSVEFPSICPSCGGNLQFEGVHLCCKNPNCKSKTIKEVFGFIRKIGIENVAIKTLEKLNIYSMKDLTSLEYSNTFTPSIIKFYNSLQDKLYHSPIKELLRCCNTSGIGDKNFSSIWDIIKTYPETITPELLVNTEDISNKFYNYICSTYPDKARYVYTSLFLDGLKKNIEDIKPIITSEKYSPIEIIIEKTNNTNKKRICFTGALYSISRKSAYEKAESAGYIPVDSVNSKTDYLVTNDKNSNSSKNKKAKELKISIISEDEFLRMVNSQETDLDML